MISKKIFVFLLNLSLILFFSGCGTKGGTSVIEYSSKAILETGQVPTLNLSSLVLRDGGTRLINFGTQPWGEFNKDGSDLHILKQSFKKSFIKNNRMADKKEFPLNIHVIINRYLVAHSNADCIAVACVSWCVTDINNNILFHETFFARNERLMLTTIGAVKDSINRNIIARIMEKSLCLNCDNSLIKVENTSDNFNEIIKGFSRNLISIDANILMHVSSKHAVSAEKIELDWVNYSAEINWKERLKMQY